MAKNRIGPPIFESRRMILIVEDDHILRHMLADMIELPHYEIYCVDNGLRAKEILDLNPHAFQLVIADIHTPELNGIALLRHIRKTSNIPVLVMTGDIQLDPEEIKKLGANDVISKPFSGLKIIDAVQACLLTKTTDTPSSAA